MVGASGTRVLGALLLGGGVAGLGFACGGTTGREDLPVMTASGMDAGAVLDSTVAATEPSLDAALFDVATTYVDHVLPDVGAPPDASAGDAGASRYPNCPGFLPVDADGGVLLDPDGGIALDNEFDQAPAAYDDAGNVILAPAGSPCATYGWLGSTAIDECTTVLSVGSGPSAYQLLPPCNSCAQAGVAAQGTGAGQPRYSLCMDLYACIIQSGCADQQVSNCFCGSSTGMACTLNPVGPCEAQEMAALEEVPGSAGVLDALKQFTSLSPSFLGVCGSTLNALFKYAGAENHCLPTDGGTGD